MNRFSSNLGSSILAICCGSILCGCDPASPGQPQETEQTQEKKDEVAEKVSSEEKAPANKPNHLAKETSPYLLLHAHNPVDWYPWGEEALAKAKQEGKPIFLSIGYSSCYWCHVMERESFTDEEIAAYLNEHFVCIKVDREERPDVDEIYMEALHVQNQRGGWPLSMFLTPDAKPFFGGTYFPARDGPRGTGFLTVIHNVQKAFTDKDQRAKLLKRADANTADVQSRLQQRPVLVLVPLEQKNLDELLSIFVQQHDSHNGGFRRQGPKFPSPSNLLFLLDRMRRGVPGQARPMLLKTLEKMAQGGIRDHLGGGFHRYSVDPRWHIPHFEKMLYDNAQLATVYAEAYALTRNDAYRRVLVELLEFVLRELTDKQGGFYSALDAETDAVEGKFYIWKRAELEKLLTQQELRLLDEIYGTGGRPNFEGHFYVPQLARPLAESAAERKTSAEKLNAQLAPIRAKLLAARSKRKRPLTDTKILTSWNGLMIRGFADAGRVLKEDRYTKAAARAADFALAHLLVQGRLKRTHTAGKARLNAYLSDYAFLCDGLIGLHQATGEKRWLESARALTDKQIELFWDQRDGGFFFTSADHETLIARSKAAIDNVIPAGATVTAGNLLYLAQALPEPQYRKQAEATLKTLAQQLQLTPSSVVRGAVVLAELLELQEKEKQKRKPKE